MQITKDIKRTSAAFLGLALTVGVAVFPAPAAFAEAPSLQGIIQVTNQAAYERFNKLGNDAYFAGYYDVAEKNYIDAMRELKKTNTVDERWLKTRNNLGNTY